MNADLKLCLVVGDGLRSIQFGIQFGQMLSNVLQIELYFIIYL